MGINAFTPRLVPLNTDTPYQNTAGYILVAVEPQINNLYLVNGSVVKINWSEPIQPNGMITKYEVGFS